MTWNPLALATALQTVPEQNIDVTNSENALIIKMNDYGDFANQYSFYFPPNDYRNLYLSGE
ncbi:cytoplasmic protein [Escherichia coli]|nr:cytoplasmic protein [Escherichia coli]